MVAPLMKYIKKILQILQLVTGNSAIRKKICEKNPSTFTETRRNFDVLIIGEKYDVTDLVQDGKLYLQFDAPDRSLWASFLILQGKFSWLKEERGKCIIICKKKNEKIKTISLFDVPFLHRIIINKYKLNKQQLELRYPLLFHPLEVYKFFVGGKYNVSSVVKCPLPEIEEFCAHRDIGFEYRVINK